MIYKATLNNSTATITVTTINNMANIKITGAANLGDQLHALATNPSAEPIDNMPAYTAYPIDTGVRLATHNGQIDVPWRWLTSIAEQLRAT